MEYKVYKSLDKPSAFFGIRGRFSIWMAMGLAVDLFISFVVGTVIVGMLGVVVFVALALVIYMYILSVQGRLTPRQLTKKMDSRKFVSCIRLKPVSVYSMLSGKDYIDRLRERNLL